MALQAFIELGLGTVITQFVSHEWSRLELDISGGIRGDLAALSRLVSVGRIAARLYSSTAIALGVSLGVASSIQAQQRCCRWAS